MFKIRFTNLSKIEINTLQLNFIPSTFYTNPRFENHIQIYSISHSITNPQFNNKLILNENIILDKRRSSGLQLWNLSTHFKSRNSYQQFNINIRNYISESNKNNEPMEWQINKTKYGKVLIDKNNWEFDNDATQYANNLITTESEVLFDGVERTPLNIGLQSTEENNPQLFATQSARTVWNYVFQHCEKKNMNHAVVTGNPGIGKSRSMAYFLRILLQNGKTVIYESRKDKQFFVFIPKKNSESKLEYEGYSVPSENFVKANCAALKNPNNYYLIDPKGIVEEGTYVAHTILAASPNKRRYHEMMKEPGSKKFFIPPWTISELQSIRDHMLVEFEKEDQQRILEEKELENRYQICGGIPRIIFSSESDFNSTVKIISNTIQDLDFEKLLKLISEVASGNQESESRISSLLVVINVSTYMYENFEKYIYTSGVVTVSSDYIAKSILIKYYREIMNFLDPRNTMISSPHLRYLLEIISYSILIIGGSFNTKNLSNPKASKLIIPSTDNNINTKNWKDFVNKWSELSLITDTKEYSRKLISGTTNQSAIDSVDALDRGFQITKNKDHPLNGMQLCRMIENSKLSGKFTESHPFHIYFVVPEYIYKDFSKQNINWESIKNYKPSMNREDLSKIIQQHALCIPLNPSPDVIQRIISKMKEIESKFGRVKETN